MIHVAPERLDPVVEVWGIPAAFSARALHFHSKAVMGGPLLDPSGWAHFRCCPSDEQACDH